MYGAPLPAGRIMKLIWAALCGTGVPTRPSTVPAITRAPFFSGRSVELLELSPRPGVNRFA